MRASALVLLALTVTAASAQPGVADVATGWVVGIVTDAETGDRLPYAAARIVGTEFGAVADDEGQFVIDGLPPGRYEVAVEFVGAERWQGSVRVRAGRASGVWPELEFEVLCDCVVVVHDPVLSDGVYQARVVRYVSPVFECCTPAGSVRRAAPLPHWESR